MWRGAHIGYEKIKYEGGLPSVTNSDGEVEAPRSLEDRREHSEEMTPQRLIEFSDEELLRWFLSESAYTVGKTLGLPVWKVQALRSTYLEVDRSEVEQARIVLGYTMDGWQRRKLGLAIEKARTELAIQDLRDADGRAAA
ncbi:MAG: hypothetical protein WB716_08600 [Candidatus Acidiferrales bacterium]